MKFKIFNEKCEITMERLIKLNKKVNLILTSPPYNTQRPSLKDRGYDIYKDLQLSDSEYSDWMVKIFNYYDKILEKDGCVLFNISYGTENPNNMYITLFNLITKTNFMIADCIVWKKKSAMPNNVSKNKLTRIVEYVYVFCRKEEYKTFNTNKKVVSVRKTGQNVYENIFNFIEAKNNDGYVELNKATYSSELCEKLLNIYAKPNSVIYDSFNGTGTTGVACLKLGHKYIGSEISKEQTEYSIQRLSKVEVDGDT